MLEKCGYNLLEAGSSKKAIEIFNSHKGTIHLVISDIVIPETSGPEMVQELFKIQPDMKVIFMSGYAGDEIIHDEVFKILHSQYPFIEKPFTFEDITMAIRQQLDNNFTVTEQV